MRRRSPSWGSGLELIYPPFLVAILFDPPSPHFFCYLGLVLSPSRLWTHMSRNSSLKSLGLLLSERPL